MASFGFHLFQAFSDAWEKFSISFNQGEVNIYKNIGILH